MLITENKIRKIIKEELGMMSQEEGRYGGRRYGGYSKPRTKEWEEARNALEDAIDKAFPRYYEERKAELSAKGKGIKSEEEVRSLIEKEKEMWVSSYKAGIGRGTEDDRGLGPSERIMQMPPRLQRLAEMGQAYIPNWDVRNNMYDGSSDY